MMTTVAPFLVDALVLMSLAGMSLAILGVIRMPDLYTRVQAAGQTIWLGVTPLVLALFALADLAIALKGLLLLLFLLLTTPVAAHAIARAAYRAGREDHDARQHGSPARSFSGRRRARGCRGRS